MIFPDLQKIHYFFVKFYNSEGDIVVSKNNQNFLFFFNMIVFFFLSWDVLEVTKVIVVQIAKEIIVTIETMPVVPVYVQNEE
jgi:hypothetical protein